MDCYAQTLDCAQPKPRHLRHERKKEQFMYRIIAIALSLGTALGIAYADRRAILLAIIIADFCMTMIHYVSHRLRFACLTHGRGNWMEATCGVQRLLWRQVPHYFFVRS